MRHQPQRVGVHEERVALAVVHGHRTVRGHGIARQLVIETIIARQHIAVHRIVELDVAERLTIARYAVVEQAVTRQLPALVGQDRAVHQFGLLGDGVVNASFGIDMVIIAHDVRRSQDGGHLGQGTVFQGVRSQHEAGIDQLDILVEDSQLGGGTVLAPPRIEDVDRVLQGASLEVIAQVHHPVIVQAVRGEDSLPINHPHILAKHGQLRNAVVVEVVAVDEERVTLFHPDIAESFHGVDFLKDKSAVTPHIHAVVLQADVADEHQHVGPIFFVRHGGVGIEQIHAGLLLFRLPALGFLGAQPCNAKQAQNPHPEESVPAG